VPLQMWTWVFVTAGSIAFFNYVRIGRKPHWLPHKVRAICYSHRQYRALPNGARRSYCRSWLIEREDIVIHSTETLATISTATLLKQNLEFQEACEERWNSLLLTTN
jgi:hypothetical protein